MKSIVIRFPGTHANFVLKVPDCVVAYRVDQLDPSSRPRTKSPTEESDVAIASYYRVTLRALTKAEASRPAHLTRTALGTSWTWVFNSMGGFLKPVEAQKPEVQFSVSRNELGSWLLESEDPTMATSLRLMCEQVGAPDLFKSRAQTAVSQLRADAEATHPS